MRRALPRGRSRGARPASRSPTSSASGASAGSSFASTARVLVPRPETEVLVERCLALAGRNRPAARARRRRRARARSRWRSPTSIRERGSWPRTIPPTRSPWPRRTERASGSTERSSSSRASSSPGVRRAVRPRRLEPAVRRFRGPRRARSGGARLRAPRGARRDRRRRRRSQPARPTCSLAGGAAGARGRATARPPTSRLCSRTAGYEDVHSHARPRGAGADRRWTNASLSRRSSALCGRASRSCCRRTRSTGSARRSAPCEPVQRLYELKGRAAKQPTALVAADLDDAVRARSRAATGDRRASAPARPVHADPPEPGAALPAG